MTNLNALLLKQAKEATALTDQSEVTQGGFDNTPVATKRAPARFIGYVEQGLQPQPDYKGKAKEPANELILTFEIFGSANTREIEDEKTKKKKKVGNLLHVRVTEKLSDKAKFKKLFAKMTRGRPITHLSHMLNEVFLVEVRVVKSKNDRMYATLEAEDGTYNINGPEMDKVDDEGNTIGTVDVTAATPPASVPFKLFIMSDPTIEQWESIHIDGTYTKKVKGEDGTEAEVEHSKNFLQETIMEALDFEGSAIQAILLGLDGEEDQTEEEDVAEDEETEETEEEETVEDVEDVELEEEEETPPPPPAKKTVAKAPAKAPVKAAPAKAVAAPAKKSATVAVASTKTATTSVAPAKTKSPSKAVPTKKAVDKKVEDDMAALGL